MTARSHPSPIRPRRPRRRGLFGWAMLLAVPLVLLGWLGYQGVYRSRQAAREAAAPKAEAQLTALSELFAADFASTDVTPDSVLARARTYREVPEPEPVNEAQTIYAQALAAPVPDRRTLLEKIASEFPNARAASGLPLLALVRWDQLQSQLEAAASAEPTKDGTLPEALSAGFEKLARTIVVTHPSPLTSEFLDRAQTALGPKGVELAGPWRTRWMMGETLRKEFAETARKSPGFTAPGWLGEGEKLLYVEPDGDQFLLLRKRQVQKWGEEFSKADPKPGRLKVALDCGGATDSPLFDPRSQTGYQGVAHVLVLKGEPLAIVPPGSELLAQAEAGPFSAVTVISDGSLFFAEQDQQALWLATLLASALLAVAGTFIALSRTLSRERQLGELKSDFLSSVSHELRAPIASMRLMAENLVSRTVTDERRQAEYHRLIADECRRLSALIGNVLDFARIEQGRQEYQFEETDLNALIADTVRLLNPRAEARRQTLQVSVKPLEQIPQVDGLAVQQALINLVDNALKFAPPETAITIALRPRDATYWELSVADQGPGIDPSEHEHIFERFYRVGSELCRETPGAGIGLSLVKHLAESHGGRVEVASQPGKGAKFTLILPFLPSAKS